MRRGTPSDDDALDESSLDEYGVWVKAGPEESVAGTDETVADLIDTAGDIDDMPSAPGERTPLPPVSDFGLEEPLGEDDLDADIPRGQEVSQMSEQDNGKSTSQIGSSLDENEIKIDDDELTLDTSDGDLDDLSDMLLNIDDENSNEETIYLEDDELSLDLEDGPSDLVLEQDSSDPQPGDDFSDDIVIPGLDDGELSIDIGSQDSLSDISLDSSSTSDLELESGDLFPDPIASADKTANDPLSAELETHSLAETGLDEFIDEQMQTPIEDDFDLETSLGLDEMTIEEESLGNLGLDLSEEGEEIVLDEALPDLSEDPSFNSSDSSLDVSPLPTSDLDDPITEELSLDADLELDVPGAESSGTEDDFGLSLSEDDDLSMAGGPDIEFDDVGALRDDLASDDATSRESEPVDTFEKTETSASDSGAASQILRSIEDELHAIRSELTDLRSELRKLRSRGDDVKTIEEQIDGIGDQAEALGDIAGNVADETTEEDSASLGKGFFDDDEDETIALTGDELDNILNSADFTEETGTPDSLDDDVEMPESTPVSADNGLGEINFDEPDDSPMPELMTTGPSAAYEDAGTSSDYPAIEEISLQEMSASDTSPAASSNVDGTNSEQEDPFEGSEREIENMAQIDIEQELAGIEDLSDEEDDIELYTGSDLDSIELDLPEDYSTESEILLSPETGSLPDGEIEGISIESDSNDKPLAESEDASEAPSALSGDSDEMSFNLKQEIKAVLAYMDKLLESLPEDKIEEFARSEHFDVYKKLFEELGL